MASLIEVAFIRTSDAIIVEAGRDSEQNWPPSESEITVQSNVASLGW
jgi:hypothetical protein